MMEYELTAYFPAFSGPIYRPPTGHVACYMLTTSLNVQLLSRELLYTTLLTLNCHGADGWVMEGRSACKQFCSTFDSLRARLRLRHALFGQAYITIAIRLRYDDTTTHSNTTEVI